MIFIKKSYKTATVALLVLIIGVFDYATTLHLSNIDLVYRELYFIPVFLGGYWFGRKGGIFAAVASSVVYLPCAMLGTPLGGAVYYSNMLEVLFFNAVGYIVGGYYDLRRSGPTLTTSEDDHEEEPSRATKNILLCIYSASNTFRAARYIADHYAHQSQTTITLLALLRVQPQEFFSTKEEFQVAAERSNAEMALLVSRVKAIIVQGGVPETNIRERIITVEGKSTAEKILEEQHRRHYDMIIAGCAKMTKAQEFFLGNPNVALVREAPCPVLVVC